MNEAPSSLRSVVPEPDTITSSQVPVIARELSIIKRGSPSMLPLASGMFVLILSAPV